MVLKRVIALAVIFGIGLSSSAHAYLDIASKLDEVM